MRDDTERNSRAEGSPYEADRDLPTPHHRDIIQNLDARIEEYDKEYDYICIKGNEYLQKGKVYKVRFDGEKYAFIYFTKNGHGLCKFNKKGLDKYFKRVRI